jgi:hypothetical protein
MWRVVLHGDSRNVLEKDSHNANSVVRGACSTCLDDVDERGRNTVARAVVRDECCSNGRLAREERGMDEAGRVCVGCRYAIGIHLLERRLLT